MSNNHVRFANIRKIRWIAIGLVVSLTSSNGHAQIACKYEVTIIAHPVDCGVFGPSIVTATCGNDVGMVAGHTSPCLSFVDIPFIWTAKDGFQQLSIPGATNATVADLDIQSNLVGTADFPGAYKAYLRTTDGQMIDLGTGPGGTNSEAYAISDSGVIAGQWGNTVTGPSPIACLWIDRKLVDLRPTLGTSLSVANDVNQRGLITGWAGTSPVTDALAYVLEGNRVTWLPPIPGGYTSEGESVNAQGNVVGRGIIHNPISGQAEARAYAWIDGHAFNLGALPGTNKSYAYDINIHNTVVGWSSSRAFIWHDSLMIDLNDLIPEDTNVLAQVGYSIRDDGVIIASGTIGGVTGEPVGLVLTPVHQSPADLDGDCHVNGADLVILLAAWGPAKSENSAADLSRDGVVNGIDLAMLLASWS